MSEECTDINKDSLVSNQLTSSILNNPFNFINNSEKLSLLIRANEMLNINKCQQNGLVFVYSAPKVGSTSIVSSLRIFASNKLDIIHIHDEEMLNVLGHIKDITINELILFNKYLGKNIYVIDVYRNPIERKISTFFEKIGSYHFNNSDNNVNNYKLDKIIHRFNKIFPHIGIGDHFMDRYNIPIPESFDFVNKYLLVEHNGIKYLKLRLNDSHLWNGILTKIFKTTICAVKDYESKNKDISNIYLRFKSNYKIPINLLNDVMKCKYLNYYYSPDEINHYYNIWSRNSSPEFIPYTSSEYQIYQEISLENCHIDYIQLNHYIDEGCLCKACGIKRTEVANKLLKGETNFERIVHQKAKNDLIQKKVNQVNKINQVIHNINANAPKKRAGKDFKADMSTLVVRKR